MRVELQNDNAQLNKQTINNVLLNLLQERTSTINNGIRNTTSLADIARYIPESIIELYKDNKSEELLKEQLDKVQKFMQDSRVQKKVAADFDAAKYSIFDPSNGDNNCESRSCLVEIMQKQSKGTLYESLEPEEKLFLTLCHVIRLYRVDQRDVFGLLVYEKGNASQIAYEGKNSNDKIKLSNFNSLPKANSPKYGAGAKIAYTACELMGQAMSCISVEFMQKVDDIVNNSQLSIQLESYQRTEGGKLLPQQLSTEAAFKTMLSYIKVMQIPFIYKITRMESILSSTDNVLQYKCQGVDLIVKLGDGQGLRYASDTEIEALKNQPAGIFEMYSNSTPKTEASDIEALKPLSGAKTFATYLENLKSMNIEDLILQDAKQIDAKHNNKPYTITGLGGYYALKESGGYVRNEKGSILTPCHFYVSTYAMEKESLNKIPLNLFVGKDITPEQYMVRM